MHETSPSPDSDATDSAETRVLGSARRIPLNLVYDYPVRWSKYKVLRDLIQNFFDSIPRAEWDRRIVHRLVGERLTLISQGVDFSYDWLIPIGASTKRDGDSLIAGYFGEGFKTDFGGIDHGLAPPVGTAALGRGDPLELALAAQIIVLRNLVYT